MTTYEIETMYDDYCDECEELGIDPKPIDIWWEEIE